MAYFFDNLKNNFDFFLRRKLIFTRKNYTEKPDDLSDVFNSDEEKVFWQKLEEKYGKLSENTTERGFLENLYFLNLFDRCFSDGKYNKLSVLDIGSKNWSYVKSEYLFFRSQTDNLVLNGIELDAYRLCSNFYNRYEIAKFYIKNLEGTKYFAGDFMKHNENYDRIVWILPFVTEYPLIRWGLPLKYFIPQKMLEHAVNILNTDGELLIINQGLEEYKIQQELNTNLDSVKIEYFGEIEDKYNLFKNKRYCSKIIKT